MKKMFFPMTICSLLLAGSCNLFPDDPELPPITMEGRNTFGCLVDGKLFLPEAPIGYGTGISAALQTAIDTIGINIQAGNIETDQSFFLSIYDSPILETGKYMICRILIFSFNISTTANNFHVPTMK